MASDCRESESFMEPMRKASSSNVDGEPYYEIMLGGADLEMAVIKAFATRLLGAARVHDAGLKWGARASSYEREIRAALGKQHTPVLIELAYDLADDIPRQRLIEIDHHGAAAGKDKPSALRQIVELLAWTRWHRLVEFIARFVVESADAEAAKKAAEGMLSLLACVKSEGLQLGKSTADGNGLVTATEIVCERRVIDATTGELKVDQAGSLSLPMPAVARPPAAWHQDITLHCPTPFIVVDSSYVAKKDDRAAGGD